MLLRFLPLCIALAVLPTIACGQTESGPSDRTTPVTRAEFNQLAQTVNNLASNFDVIVAKLDTIAENTSTTPDANQIGSPDVDSGLVPTLEALAQRVAALEQKLDVLTEVQHNHETQLGQIVRQDQDGSFYLQLNTKNPAGRNEVRRAIQEAAPEVGRIVVTNRMASDQFLFVDGDGFRVPANMTREIPVRRGTVSTNLPGQDAVLWTIAAPDYEQRIDIRPRQMQQPTTVARPVAAPTIFVDPRTGIGYVASR